jgi:hypothetical protein
MASGSGDTGRDVAAESAQYRQRHAEPESSVASLCPGTFDFVLVVPVYGESPDFVDGFRAAAGQAGSLLLVVVLNGRGGATATVHSANDGCFRALSRRFALRALGPGSWLGHETDPTGTPGAPESRLSVLVVDRFTPGRRLPARQGVGLARKIGADVALELIVAGGVRHPYIAMTDADARLPEDYFARIAAIEPGCSGAMFPFWHEPGGERQMDRATALYEIRLRYFQRGLQWAHSPYAFHTVGSTMVVDALSYALVRGVPRRRAGEDFYLLNKLSKLRPLAHLQGAPIRLRSRLSERVPFGTGSESAKLVRGAELELYHPDCFTAVRQLMQVLRRLSGAGAAPGSTVSRPVVSDLLAAMNPVVRRFLEHQGALDAWPGIVAQAPSPVARLRRLHDWFDGFRTLKLIHYLRDGGSPSLPWKEAVRRAPFMDEVDVGDDGATLMTTRTGLLRLEQDLPQLIGPSVEE